MTLTALNQRAADKCELCSSPDQLSVYEVPPTGRQTADPEIFLCGLCLAQITKQQPLDSTHWRCLTGSMWSDIPAVQVVAWRMLSRLSSEAWAAESLEMLYLDDTLLGWAKATGDHEDDGEVELHVDSNGSLLQDGDTVVLIKSLDVKGSTLTAKMGTVVKNIRLVSNNPSQIEGRVEGQLIVILTKFVRRQGA